MIQLRIWLIFCWAVARRIVSSSTLSAFGHGGGGAVSFLSLLVFLTVVFCDAQKAYDQISLAELS